jgi:hypothetical protein
VTLVPVDEPVGQAALLAFERYGKGRHHASLNMGDCFAYGCASEALPRPCAAAVSNAKRRRVGRGGKTCDRPARPWPSPSEKRWRRKFGLRAKGRWATTREKYERGAETFERSGDLRDQTLAKDLRTFLKDRTTIEPVRDRVLKDALGRVQRAQEHKRDNSSERRRPGHSPTRSKAIAEPSLGLPHCAGGHQAAYAASDG